MTKPHSKACNVCGHIKPISDFYVARARPGGYQSACKLCQKTYYLNRPESPAIRQNHILLQGWAR